MTGAFSCDSKSSRCSHLPPVLAAITTSRMGARPELQTPRILFLWSISCKGSSSATSQSPERELLRPNPKFIEFWKLSHPRLGGGQHPTRAAMSPEDFVQKTPRAQHTAPRMQPCSSSKLQPQGSSTKTGLHCQIPWKVLLSPLS